MERLELARLLRPDRAAATGRASPCVVDERDPGRFQQALAAAAAGRGPVFLADPAWGRAERQALAEALGRAAEPGAHDPERGWLMVPSGGTSGRTKFARHDQDTLLAAVRGFCGGVGVERVNAVGLLPLHHVSGLMAWLRTAATGGRYVAWDWKRLQAGEFPREPEGEGWYLSLVPTQLQRLLASADALAWLRRFDLVFLGGGPVWPALAEEAARAALPISQCYGMTETAAMVAAQRPGEFARGDRSSGGPLPHARIEITPEGTVGLAGPSVSRGYFPFWSADGRFATEDLGRIDSEGRLHLEGRRDSVIITGGKKVDPLEVEAALRASGQFEDVAVLGVPDPEWGQSVVACYPGEAGPPDAARLAAQVETLAPHKRPRRYCPVSPWPRNAQGKLNRGELLRLLK